MMKAKASRFVMLEFFIRTMISLLAMITILVVIFTTPKGDNESVIDQTMNFTALVILLEVDNILAALLQKKIDQYDVKEHFKYDPNTIKKHFNKTQEFITDRQGLFFIQRKMEVLFFVILFVCLYVAFTVIPIGMLILYVIVPPCEVALP